MAGQSYALPSTFARESFMTSEAAVEEAHGREWVRWRDGLIPLTRLQRLFGGAGNGSSRGRGGDGAALKLVALEFGGERLAVSVDRFVGEEEIVVKTFDPPRGSVPVFAGAMVMPDGRPALVIDVGSLS